MNKRLRLLTTFVVLTVATVSKSNAQVSVNVNIGAQPMWGPVGYERVDYYYLPDVEAYYYVPRRQFVYLSGGSWVFAASLPGRYRNYDLYSGYKVVINEPRPYMHYDMHRTRYAGYCGARGRQVCIRDNGPRYERGRGHGHHEHRKHHRHHDHHGRH